MEKRPDQEASPAEGPPREAGPDDFFGLDVEKMSPRSQVTTSLAVLIPVAIAGVLVLTLAQGMWWLIFVFGWMIFPAFGLLVRGIAGLSERPGEPTAANTRERELLEALHRRGELTPAQAAMETSLTVSEADEMLKNLASKGGIWTSRCVAGAVLRAVGRRFGGRKRELGSEERVSAVCCSWYHSGPGRGFRRVRSGV